MSARVRAARSAPRRRATGRRACCPRRWSTPGSAQQGVDRLRQLHVARAQPVRVVAAEVRKLAEESEKAAASIADLVTEMTLVKHPFRAGIKAQPGVEF